MSNNIIDKITKFLFMPAEVKEERKSREAHRQAIKEDKIPTMHFDPNKEKEPELKAYTMGGITITNKESRLKYPLPTIKEKWIDKIRIYEQEDFVKGHSTRDGMVNMQSSINEYLAVIGHDSDKRLISVTPSYAGTDDANFHMIYTIHYQVNLIKGDN